MVYGGSTKRFGMLEARLGAVALLAVVVPSCAGVKSFMAIEETRQDSRPIQNPFGTFYEASGASPQPGRKDSLVVRTKSGDRSLEFEIPANETGEADLAIPAASAAPRSADPASPGSYSSRGTSVADNEILWKIPEAPADQSAARRQLEVEMGLHEAASTGSPSDRSYLGRLDLVKQLYRDSRFEASLLEVEDMLKDYPMDARLHEMRGTLLERIGHEDLAVQSWRQALEIQPSNESLRNFLEMKRTRAPASVGGDR